jgi:hypothetical protein
LGDFCTNSSGRSGGSLGFLSANQSKVKQKCWK